MTRFQALAALLCLLPASSAVSAPSLSQNNSLLLVPRCYRTTTEQERLYGLPAFIPVDYCSQDNGQFCFTSDNLGRFHPAYGCGTVPPDFFPDDLPDRPVHPLLPW